MDPAFETTETLQEQDLQELENAKRIWKTPTLRIANTEDTASGGLSSFFENTNYYPTTASVS